jgi:DnaJ homolog subfamily C member 22
MGAKSLKIAYLFCILGGLFGLHHFYLGRHKQALVWLSTLGGFIIGTLFDLYKMRQYVNEANQEEKYMQKFYKYQSQIKVPAFITNRSIGSVICGAAFAYLTNNCVPAESDEFVYLNFFFRALSPFVAALMIYLVSTEGPFKCSFKWPLIGSYMALAICAIRGNYSNVHLYCAILGTLFLNWNIDWDYQWLEKKKKSGACKKLKKTIAFVMYSGLILTIMVFYALNNFTFEVDGKPVTFKEGIKNFFKSKEFNKVQEIFTVLWNFYKAYGFKQLIYRFAYGLCLIANLLFDAANLYFTNYILII